MVGSKDQDGKGSGPTWSSEFSFCLLIDLGAKSMKKSYIGYIWVWPSSAPLEGTPIMGGWVASAPKSSWTADVPGRENPLNLLE